jgi:hypothetical protein
LVSVSSFDDEDFAFSLLDEFFWTLELEDLVELLLDPIASLQDDDEGVMLAEDFAELDESAFTLPLDFPVFSLELDCFASP